MYAVAITAMHDHISLTEHFVVGGISLFAAFRRLGRCRVLPACRHAGRNDEYGRQYAGANPPEADIVTVLHS
jgi:hypothetical protein